MASTASPHGRWFLALGGIAAALAVALDAAARHSLQTSIAASDPAGWFAIALEYHRYHALGLIAVGLAATVFPSSRWFAIAGWLIATGILLFCGNLYLRNLAGIHTLHAATPFGGGAFILGWLAFAVGTIRQPHS